MDISDTLAPTSDQLDAVDLLTGPRTFTVERVTVAKAEQPVNIYLREFPRPWRPGKSMRRVIVACWGSDVKEYVGRRVTLWCDPSVRFGGQEVGGVRVTHLSHIEKAKKVPLLITRGKSATYVVEPLPDAPGAPTEADVAACEDQHQLRAWWIPFPALRPAIEARVEALKQDADQADALFQQEAQA